MSKAAKELVEKFKDLTNKGIDRCFMVTVQSVDKSSDTCSVVFDGLPIDNVRLKATMDNNKGLKVYPSLGSNVLIERLGDGYFSVSMVSQIESIELTIDNKKWLVNKNGHFIGDADNTLLSVLNLIIDAVKETIVFQGRNPNYEKLIQAKEMASQILQ